MRKRKLISLLVLLMTAVTGAVAQTISLDFEDGEMPQGWTHYGATDGWYVDGDDYYGHTPAFSGNYSLYIDGNGEYDCDYFVSPAINFQGEASLSFAYSTTYWSGDFNDLTVAYGTTPDGPWTSTSFAEQTSDGWTTATVDLSFLNGTYYIAFISYDGYGYSTAIDNINFVVPTAPAATLAENDDNTEKLAELNGSKADVTLTRTLMAGGYNTFAVPFDLAIPEGWTVKELNSASFANDVLTLNFATATSIEAGKPYLVKVAANVDLSAAPFTGVTVSKDAVPYTSATVDFIPTLGATAIPAGDTKAVLFFAADNTLLNPSVLPANIKGFRAYFQLKGEVVQQVRAFCLDFGDGESTGIRSIESNGKVADDAIYTLDGRRVSQPTKGIYIQNGKKLIIK